MKEILAFDSAEQMEYFRLLQARTDLRERVIKGTGVATALVAIRHSFDISGSVDEVLADMDKILQETTS